jgi:hypothetical protein
MRAGSVREIFHVYVILVDREEYVFGSILRMHGESAR